MQRIQSMIHNGTLRLSDQVYLSDILLFIIFRNDYFQLWLLYKVTSTFLLQENIYELSEINTIKPKKRQFFHIIKQIHI